MHVLVLVQSYVRENQEDPRDGAKFKAHLQQFARAKAQVGLAAPYQKYYSLADAVRNKGFLIHDQEYGYPVIRDILFDTALRRFPRFGVFRRIPALMLRTVRAYIKKHGRPDIIHAHGSMWAGLVALQAYEQLGIPYVLTEHMTIIPTKQYAPQDFPLLKKIFRTAKYVMPISNVTGLALERVLGDSCKPWTAVPNVIDLNFFDKDATPISLEPPVFFFVGRQVYDKGVDVLLEAFAKKFKNTAVVLKIGGDGPHRATFEQMAVDLGIHRQVTFLGYLSRADVAREMRGASISVIPSRKETFGIPAIEAAACGRPAIVTRCGGPEDIVTESSGVIVPPEDPDALARAMQAVLENIHSYDPAAIRKHCLEQYAPQKVIGKFISCYEKALATV